MTSSFFLQRVTCWVPKSWSIIYTWLNVCLEKRFSGKKVKKMLKFCWLVDFFLHRSRMLGPHVRLLSIVTPNTLWSLTSVICWLQKKGAQMVTEIVVASDTSLVSWRVKKHMIKMCPFYDIRETWLENRCYCRYILSRGVNCCVICRPTCHIVQKGYVKAGHLYRCWTGEVLRLILRELQIKLSWNLIAYLSRKPFGGGCWGRSKSN